MRKETAIIFDSARKSLPWAPPHRKQQKHSIIESNSQNHENPNRDECDIFYGRHCNYSHDVTICPKYHPGSNSGSMCQDTGCTLRHPRLCTHFMRSKCHFNKKCLLYHPEGLPPDELHPWILKLQQSFDAMVVEISDLKQVVRILKTKLPPDPGDPSQYADLPTPLILGVYAEQVHRVTPQATLQSALYQPRSEEDIRAIKDMHLHSANLAIRLPTPPHTFSPTQGPTTWQRERKKGRAMQMEEPLEDTHN